MPVSNLYLYIKKKHESSSFADCKIVVQILLLAYIFPPRSSYKYKSGNKFKSYKPTIKECQSSMIEHINVSNLFKERLHPK